VTQLWLDTVAAEVLITDCRKSVEVLELNSPGPPSPSSTAESNGKEVAHTLKKNNEEPSSEPPRLEHAEDGFCERQEKASIAYVSFIHFMASKAQWK
jgi:hypothetical protein